MVKRVRYEIIIAATGGDGEKISYIIEFYSPRIDRELWKLAPGLSKESREDCRQEICIGLMMSISEFVI